MEEKKKWKRKAAVGAACATVSAGILVGGAFDSPADLLGSPDSLTISAQAEDNVPDCGQERRSKSGFLRRGIASLPLGIRAWVCVPLWCIGWAVLELCQLLCGAVLTPVGGMIFAWLLAAAMVFGVLCLVAKAMFPGVPLKKLLKPRHFLWVVGGMFFLAVADFVLPYFWEDYPRFSRFLRMLGSAALVGLGALRLWHLGRKLCKEEKDRPGRTAVEQAAMSLADTVCPRPVYHVE